MFSVATRGRAAGDSIGGLAFGVVLQARRAAAGSRIAFDLPDLKRHQSRPINPFVARLVTTHLATIARLPGPRGIGKLLPRATDLANIVEQPARRLVHWQAIAVQLLRAAFARGGHLRRAPCSQMVTSVAISA